VSKQAIRVKAMVNGVWRVVGTLRGNVFEQRIKERDILKIRGAAGVDLRYDPPLREDTVIRHKVEGGAVYEITLRELLSHAKARVERIGPLHPQRVYLSYKYWRRVDDKREQLRLFA